MRRPRSLLTAASQIFASSPIESGLIVSKATPPAQSVELWHLPQYWSKKCHSGGSCEAPCPAAPALGAAGAPCACAAPVAAAAAAVVGASAAYAATVPAP